MRRHLGFLAIVVAISATAALGAVYGHPPKWAASFTAGGTCPVTGGGTAFCGGTEGRALVALNAGTAGAILFWGNGYWEDTPGVEGPQNAQILKLTAPGGSWTVDYNLGTNCPSNNLTCALSTSAMQNLSFSFDAGGNPVTVSAIVAASWWTGTGSAVCTGAAAGYVPVYSFQRNNADGLWYPTLVLCDPGIGAGSPQIRSYGSHVDQVVSNTEYAFAGEAAIGIFNGQLSTTRAAGHNIVTWNGPGNSAVCTGHVPDLACPAEWLSANYSGPACTNQIRPMAFAEATGSDNVLRIYASACFSIYARVDGPQSTCNNDQVMVAAACVQRWQLFWSDPNPGTSESGLRGLTALQAESILITGEEGGQPENIYRVPPLGTCGSISAGGIVTPCNANVSEYTNAPSFIAATGMKVGNTVMPYNSFPLWYDAGGTGRRYVPQSSYITAATTVPPNPNWSFMLEGGTGTGKKWAEGFYLYRSSNGHYDLQTIPDLFPTPMNGTRDIISSPWPSECNNNAPPGNGNQFDCAVYATGFDADGASKYFWCGFGIACPGSPAFVPTHNTAWIARFGH